MKEESLQNAAKTIKAARVGKSTSANTLYLHWRPKSLLRLICWRFYKYLINEGKLLEISRGITDKSSYEEFLEKIWVPYFGRIISNGFRTKEESFPYVLRHTQLRPRQLIMLCNAIVEEGNIDSPPFSSEVIQTAIRNTEEELVNEVFNSYELIYPRVQRSLIRAFHNFPISFKGTRLKKVLSKFNAIYPHKKYDMVSFMELVSELGIVGRARRGNKSKNSPSSPIIEAQFEYAMEGRLNLVETDDCVIHPIFFHVFKIKLTSKTLVYPFLPHDHPDYKFYDVPTH